VGALINGHSWYRTLEVPGGPNGTVGSGAYELKIGTNPIPASVIEAPLRDVRKTGNNGEACDALPAGSLNGSIAFVARGSGQCTFALKANNVAAAGAVGVIFYRTDGSNDIFAPGGLGYAKIPAGLIGHSDGQALLGYLGSQGDNVQARLNPALRSRDVNKDANGDGTIDGILASFSSRGPNIGIPLIKPEVTAVGENIYTATQKYDPNSDLYDASGYTAVSGTSFSTPLVAGVAALVLDSQAFAFYNSEQVKSAIVNAAEDLNNFDRNIESGQLEAAYNIAMGGGEVQAPWAIDSYVTMSPQTLDFGEVTQSSLASGIPVTVRIWNNFNLQLRLAFKREAYNGSADSASSVVWNLPGPIDVPAGQYRDVTFRLTGTAPSRLDLYDGVIIVEDSGDPINNIPNVKIPYLYIAGDTAPCNIIPLRGNGGTGISGEMGVQQFTVKVTDCRGLPISGVPITWTTVDGGGQVTEDSGNTDDYGIVEASYRLGSTVGTQRFRATYPNSGGIYADFIVQAIGDPVVNQGGIVEGAGFKQGQSVAPGSFISIFGSNLAGGDLGAGTVPLPIALGEINVSIDSRDRSVSIPASLIYVSPTQINVQLPWELSGKNTAVIKVNNGDISTAVREVGVATHSPGLFQYDEGGQMLLATEIFRGGQRLGLHGSGRKAKANDTLELFANGLGPIDGGNPATGHTTPTDRLYNTQAFPEVTIGGVPAHVDFSGLAPGFVALYQVNVVVPSGLGPNKHEVKIRIGGVESSAGYLLVE